jgi:hypothetical protein
MTEPELTDVMIEAAMRRVERVACPAGDARGSGFHSPARDAIASRTSAGWCLIGFAVGDGGRLSWDAWYNVKAGEGRLRRQRD